MILRSALLLITAGSLPLVAQSHARCPWLATGSAVTALGGDVTVTANSENNWQGSCHFTRQVSSPARAIDIWVSKVDRHPCPSGSAKIKALGNEAVQCQLSISGQAAETIAGRVRETWFEVTMIGGAEPASKPSDARHPDDRYGATMLEQIAEQVAGNLY